MKLTGIRQIWIGEMLEAPQTKSGLSKITLTKEGITFQLSSVRKVMFAKLDARSAKVALAMSMRLISFRTLTICKKLTHQLS